MHNDHHADEALENEMVHGRCKQSGKDVVTSGKQRSGQNNRAIYGLVFTMQTASKKAFKRAFAG